MAELNKRQKILRLCFVVYGLFMSTAVIFVFIPNESMVWIGAYFGLDDFEITTVFEYMARGMSSLCFLVGMLLIYIGLHLRSCARLVRFLGWLALVSIPMVLFIHLKLATPFWWKAGDTGGVLLLCLMCWATPYDKKSRMPRNRKFIPSLRPPTFSEKAKIP